MSRRPSRLRATSNRNAVDRAVCDAAWRLAGTTTGAPAGFNTHVNYTGRVVVSGVPRTEFIGSVSECAYCEADDDGP